MQGLINVSLIAGAFFGLQIRDVLLNQLDIGGNEKLVGAVIAALAVLLPISYVVRFASYEKERVPIGIHTLFAMFVAIVTSLLVGVQGGSASMRGLYLAIGLLIFSEVTIWAVKGDLNKGNTEAVGEGGCGLIGS